MLNTPFGIIKIMADSIMLDYDAVPFNSKCRSIIEKPLAGCYRITVPNADYRIIRCALDWNCAPIEHTGSSGERFLCAEYERGNMILTIGIEDENPAYESVYSVMRAKGNSGTQRVCIFFNVLDKVGIPAVFEPIIYERPTKNRKTA